MSDLRAWVKRGTGSKAEYAQQLTKALDHIEALGAENTRMRDALVRIEDLTSHDMGMNAAEERCVNREARAALKGDT